MIKVLYISDTLKQRFGVTAVITNYIEHFEKDNIQVDVLVYDDSEKEVIDKLKSYGSEVYFMPKLSLKNINGYKKYIKDFFSNHKYDIIHSHFNQIDGLVFPIARKQKNCICISHSHNTKLSDYFFKAIRNRLMCLNIAKNADIWASCSEKAGIALFGKKFKDSPKSLIIHNGVDCDKFKYNEEYREEIRNEFNISEDRILIGNIGSFKPQKNQTFLVDIFNQLCKKSDKYNLIFVGDGPTQEEIKNKVKELNLQDRVIFTGTRKDIPKILSAIDIFVLPSLYEGLPVIGIEAQAAGLECVFSDTITKEVDLGNVCFIKLDATLDEWCNAISNCSFKHNENYSYLITEKGYNIDLESKRLLKRYEELTKEL